METLQPKLRFPEFDGNWERKKISEVSKIGRGKSKHRPRDAEFLYGGIYPFIQTGDIRNADLYLTKYSQTYSEEGLNQSKLWDENTLCITIAANIAETTILKIKACFPDSIIGLIPHEDKTIVLFVKYQFDKFKIEIQSLSQGVAQANLNQEKLSNIEFHFPQLQEQTKIANFLSAVDEKLNLLKEKKETLEAYKKGIMQKIFNQEIRFKDDNGNDFEDWEEKSLGEIGVTFNGLTGKTKENFGIGGKPYIQYKQIFDNSKINIEKCEFVEITEKDNQKSVQYGDVFFTVSSETPNEIGTASVLLDNVKEMYLNSFCFGYRAYSLNQLVPEFSRYLFRNELFRSDIIKLAQGSTRYNMSKVELMKLKVLLPNSKEQIKIANFLSAIDEKIELVNTQIQDTQEYKKGLLQQMFA